MSLGGGTRRGNNYTLDGVPITDLRNRMSAVPTTEGVEDMKVQVHTYDAEMGRTGGGVFNTTMKSGTNNFRGTGFFQTRPQFGMANNYFGEKAGRSLFSVADSIDTVRFCSSRRVTRRSTISCRTRRIWAGITTRGKSSWPTRKLASTSGGSASGAMGNEPPAEANATCPPPGQPQGAAARRPGRTPPPPR